MDRLGAMIDETLRWIGRLDDLVTLVMIAVGAFLAGVILGYLGAAGLGRRGRLYGAMVGGMIMDLAAKLYEASYLVAFLLMLAITALAFFVGEGTGLKLFEPKRAE